MSAQLSQSLPHGACLTSVRFPRWSGKVGTAFQEVNARSSDFAFVSAAVQLALAEDGTCQRIAIGIGAATDVPLKLCDAEARLTGSKLDKPNVREALRTALAEIEPVEDLHASATYRRRAALTLAMRAIYNAKANAQGQTARAH